MILGGGVAAVEAALALVDLTDGAAHITLVAPEDHVVLQALAPATSFGLVSGASSASLADLAHTRGFRWVQDVATEVDAEREIVRCASDRELRYDSLVVAVGAVRVAAFSDAATTYFGSASHAELVTLRNQITNGAIDSIAVIVPPGVSWTLPAYEIALMLARIARNAGVDVECTLVTPEPAAVALFGPRASAAVAELLGDASIGVRASIYPEVTTGQIRLRPGDELVLADRIVALPRAQAIRIGGLPADAAGFLPVDGYGRVETCSNVYAAGDCTALAVKQGGLAALQADVVAAHIAVEMGANVASPTFRPVMRGKLITGDAEWYLRNPAAGGAGEGDVHDEPLWMPARKVWGTYLPAALE